MSVVLVQLIPHWKSIPFSCTSSLSSSVPKVGLPCPTCRVLVVAVGNSWYFITRRYPALGEVLFLSGSCWNTIAFPRRYFRKLLDTLVLFTPWVEHFVPALVQLFSSFSITI
jgi:hypothetical protein